MKHHVLAPGSWRRARYELMFRVLRFVSAVFCAGFLSACGAEPSRSAPEVTISSEVGYTNIVDPRGPWCIHLVKIPRKPGFEFRSVHSGDHAIGTSELSDQVRSVFNKRLEVVAAVNGDFFRREGAHAGDPRGLQIIENELISAPSGSSSFWIDGKGEPHTGSTTEDFKLTWPDGSSTPFGLNGSREPDSVELFTPAIGSSTRTDRGRDIILEKDGTNSWLPLRAGKTYRARVRSVRDGADSDVAPGTMVLSLGPLVARELPRVKAGDVLSLTTGTKPDLQDAKMAVSGGPVLLRDGAVASFRARGRGGETSSVNARHPRSCIGWNKDSFYIVEVDGRMRRSVGMTLPELAGLLLNLGCTDAMNLDGGGSSTLWYSGKVRNHPCEGSEREIANSLVVVQKADGEPATLARRTASKE